MRPARRLAFLGLLLGFAAVPLAPAEGFRPVPQFSPGEAVRYRMILTLTIESSLGPEDDPAADHVLWGADSIWWGSPQWQIEALRRLEMPETLIERFGYAPLTPEVKRKIFGLNAARVFGVDPRAKREPLPDDYIDRLQELYNKSGLAAPSNTQYGWVAG